MTIVIRIVVVLMLVVGIWQCVTIAAAAGITRSVSLSLSNTTATDAAMRLAARRLDTAIALSPNYVPALYLQERTSDDVDERVDILQHITKIQPREIKAWGLLFRLSLEHAPARGHTDNTLQQIERYGAYDPVTNWLVIEAGTRHWLTLTPVQREFVIRAGARASTSIAGWLRKESMGLIEMRGFAPMVCSVIDDQSRVAICRD